jgi:hypothetical protein
MQANKYISFSLCFVIFMAFVVTFLSRTDHTGLARAAVTCACANGTFGDNLFFATLPRIVQTEGNVYLCTLGREATFPTFGSAQIGQYWFLQWI